MNVKEIEWINLAVGYLLFLFPLFIFIYYQTGLVRTLIKSMVRMTVQLLLVGLYLGFFFKYNSILLNTLWVIAITLAATMMVVERSELKLTYFALPVFMGIAAGLLITVSFLFVFVIGSDRFHEARYFIPISGMILGNSMSSSIIGLNTFYHGLSRDENGYRFLLSCGASRREAFLPYMQAALRSAFNPLLATMAAMGLVTLPGMMTGQLLGGSAPLDAIRYQILIMIGIFSGTIITVVVSILFSQRFTFDSYDLPRSEYRRTT